LNYWLFSSGFEDDGERETPEYCRLPLSQQETGIARMHRGKWLFIGIDDKNLAHDEPLLSEVMVASTRFSERFGVDSTVLTR
jgi:hypothetical protein